MKRKVLFTVTAIAATLMPATIAFAVLSPNSPTALTKLINRTANKQLGTSYERPKEPTIGQAGEGEGFYKPYNLKPGKNYAFVAVCGKPKCIDVDLAVYDSKGNELAADQSDSSEAVVKFTPKTKGTYDVEVQMYACDDTVACALGLGAYRQL
ncbi:hypothetical protein NIES4102_10040 [Chondrocystis sp. NIES-4102]|nr:hypothetical protein NIES4102_10040 [Chondrocystis sp. NIES-4102]